MRSNCQNTQSTDGQDDGVDGSAGLLAVPVEVEVLNDNNVSALNCLIILNENQVDVDVLGGGLLGTS